MKKYMISFICLISVGQSYSAAFYEGIRNQFSPDENRIRISGLRKVRKALQEASTKAFSLSIWCIFNNDPTTQENVDTWDSAINKLKNLVAEYNIKKDAMWDDYFNTIELLNNDLMNAIKEAYDGLFSPSSALQEMRREKKEQLTSQFNAIIERSREMMQQVRQHSFSSRPAPMEESMMYNIIIQLSDTITSIAKAAMRSLDCTNV